MAGMVSDDSGPSIPADAAISQSDAVAYWSSVESTVDGMLGGYPQISRIDLQSSSNFLIKLRRRRAQREAAQAEANGTTADAHDKGSKPERALPLLERAVDCGAGIGRVTHGLLVNHFAVVDVVEPVAKFTQQLAATPVSESAKGRLGTIHTCGLESFVPDGGVKYDCVWNQWCLGQLTDAQLVAWLRRCSQSLVNGGWVVVKENMCTNINGQDEFDEIDSSVTRSETKWEACFEEAGLKIAAQELQKSFPKDLFPVKIWALQPRI